MLSLSPRLQKILKWVGYPLFGLLSFIICIYVTFPYDRVKHVVEDHIAASGTMRASIGEVSSSPLLGLTLHDVKLTIMPKPPRPAFGRAAAAAPQQPARPTVMRFERITVGASLSTLFGRKLDVSFDIEGLGGSISGHYESQRAVGYAFNVKLKDINLKRVPQAQSAVGLPITGRVSGSLKLVAPRARLDNASGAINLACEGCSIGDGKAKLKVPGNALLAMGITLPRVRLGRLNIEVTIDKGKASFENVSSRSADGEIALEGSMQLRTPMAFANMSAYLKFKIAPALKRRDAKFELLTNGLARGKRSDGFYGMRLYGPLRTMRPIPSRFGPRGAGGAAGGAGRGARRGRFGGTRGVGGAGGAGRLPGRRFGR